MKAELVTEEFKNRRESLFKEFNANDDFDELTLFLQWKVHCLEEKIKTIELKYIRLTPEELNRMLETCWTAGRGKYKDDNFDTWYADYILGEERGWDTMNTEEE